MTQHDPPIPWETYYRDGREHALALGNRGLIRFDANGRPAQDIIDAYNECGFYVFTGVLSPNETGALAREFDAVLDNAPVSRGSVVDKHGRPSPYAGYYTISDDEPAVVSLVSHPLMLMDSALRVYAHPQILKMVASINGPDFVPFHEAVFHKGAGDGPPTGWHQDGRTHWHKDGRALEKSDGSGKTHGFNLSVSWSNAGPENCLWVVPGSHRKWLLADGGKFPAANEQVPDAVPMMLAPGDCGMVNRSSLHGAFANKSSERRITMVLGYHKRNSAIGAETTNVHAFERPAGPKPIKYTEDYVLRRARMIPLAIDARRQQFPHEEPYEYQGSYIGEGVWNDEARAQISKPGDEYWQRDITL